MKSTLTILDGPLGTELDARGVKTSLPLWSAAAIEDAPNIISQIHRDYADAGATVHTACTFRTKRRYAGADWKQLTGQAIEIARNSVPTGQRIAASLAPLEDCYRPDLAPDRCEAEHREFADYLAECGCDLILCETFPNGDEALQAARAAVDTGVETWLALTAGPDGDLMDENTMVATAKRAIDQGVQAVLVNCTPASITHRWVDAIAEASLNIPFGAYANAGAMDERIGWQDSQSESAALRYRSFARRWVESGATLIGGCCGTGPVHIRALRQLDLV